MPRSGWCQRQSASKPVTRPVARSMRGLEHQAQLTGADRALQVRAQHHPVDRLLVLDRVVDGHRGLAAVLGPVHRDVGVAEHLLRAGAAGPALRDPDAGAAGDRGAGQPDRLRQRADDPVRDLDGLLGGPALQQHRELVPAEPGRGVARGEGGRDGLADEPEQLVAGGVAVPVVDGLEVVEVADHHHEAVLVALPRGQRLHQPLGEQPAVGQPGHRVVQHVQRDLRGVLLLGGDVADGDHVALDGRVLQPVHHGRHRAHRRAVGALEDDLDPAGPVGLHGAQRLDQRDPALGAGQQAHQPALHPLGRTSEHRLAGSADELHARVDVQHHRRRRWCARSGPPAGAR